ncbi:hypothetical protein ACGFIF_44290 [Kribbella sp. NPDC049174]|uniref:hypothetical protein n=1 Tax=Kribbella sp. NPDC049174 TaxID=3364112 RepID=UPI00371A6883
MSAATEGTLVTTQTGEIFTDVPLDVQYPPYEHGPTNNRTFNWVTPVDEHLLRKAVDLGRLPQGQRRSIAVVDWSALNNTVRLLSEPTSVSDPFTAILDLSTVVAALINYDFMLALNYGDTLERARAMFPFAESSIVGIEAGHREAFDHDIDAVCTDARGLLERYYLEAQSLLDSATSAGAEWVGVLRTAWTALVPDTEYPRHNFGAYDPIDEGHPYEDYFRDPTIAFDSLFELTDGAWRVRADVDWALAILDNDRRSLFYEILVAQLRQHVDDQRSFTFRYLANSLRSPMQIARTAMAQQQLSQLPTAPEDWLQQEWANLGRSWNMEINLPLWMNAALYGAHGGRTIPDAVGELRQLAKGFRKRRAELEDSLFEGDVRVLDSLQAALSGDLTRLTVRCREGRGTSSRSGRCEHSHGSTGPYRAEIGCFPGGHGSTGVVPGAVVANVSPANLVRLRPRQSRQARHQCPPRPR